MDTKKLLSDLESGCVSGYLAFNGDLVSRGQLVKIMKKIVDEDKDGNWVHVVIRNSGRDEAIDFMYKSSGLPRGERLNILKKLFTDELGEDFLVRWGFADPAYVIKQ